jgi:hypothetical protein
MAFFGSGDVQLYLGVPECPDFTSRCVLYFRVDDIETEAARLIAAGVNLQQPQVVRRDGSTEVWMAGHRRPPPDSHAEATGLTSRTGTINGPRSPSTTRTRAP